MIERKLLEQLSEAIRELVAAEQEINRQSVADDEDLTRYNNAYLRLERARLVCNDLVQAEGLGQIIAAALKWRSIVARLARQQSIYRTGSIIMIDAAIWEAAREALPPSMEVSE